MQRTVTAAALTATTAGLLSGGMLLRPLLAPAPALAQQPRAAAGQQPGRYSLVSHENNLYFLDTQTGRMWYRQVYQDPQRKLQVRWLNATTPVVQPR